MTEIEPRQPNAVNSLQILPPTGAEVLVPDGNHHRLLAYGVLAVMVVEDMDIAGYVPERFQVTVGGKPADVYGCEYDRHSGRRTIDTSVGLVLIPSAAERAAGAQVTVAGVAIPGA